MGKKCFICGKSDARLFEFPSDMERRMKWLEIIQGLCDVSKIKDRSVICENHFEEDSFYFTKTSCRLLKGAVPSGFSIPVTSNYAIPKTETLRDADETNCKLVQVSIPSKELQDLRYRYKVLNQKLKRMTNRYSNCLAKVKNLELELQNQSHTSKLIRKISRDAEKSDQKALFLMDLINSYGKKSPRLSEMTIRCEDWGVFAHQKDMSIDETT